MNDNGRKAGFWIPLEVIESIKKMLKEAKSTEKAQWVCGYLFGYFETEIHFGMKLAESKEE